jgi:hypothetical protein
MTTSTLNVLHIDQIIKKMLVGDEEKLLFYILRSFKYVEICNKFSDLAKVSFGNKGINSIDVNSDLKQALINYNIISKEYIKDDTVYTTSTNTHINEMIKTTNNELYVNNTVKTRKEDVGENMSNKNRGGGGVTEEKLKCKDCGLVMENNNDNNWVCNGCGQVHHTFQDSSYNDHTRINIVNHVHNRETQFIDTINKKQGIYHVENGEQILKIIKKACEKQRINLSVLTDHSIHSILNENKLCKNYGDLPWIKWKLCGIKPISLEPIKDKLIQLHRQFSQIYHKIKNPNRKNYPTNEYLLIRFVILLNHPECQIPFEELENTLAFDRVCDYEVVIENFCNHYQIPYKKLW